MWDFMYEVIKTGEQFFVECDSFEEANNFLEGCGVSADEVKFCGRYTTEEAEMMGLDTY
jgi:hypothetical protein